MIACGDVYECTARAWHDLSRCLPAVFCVYSWQRHGVQKCAMSLVYVFWTNKSVHIFERWINACVCEWISWTQLCLELRGALNSVDTRLANDWTHHRNWNFCGHTDVHMPRCKVVLLASVSACALHIPIRCCCRCCKRGWSSCLSLRQSWSLDQSAKLSIPICHGTKRRQTGSTAQKFSAKSTAGTCSTYSSWMSSVEVIKIKRLSKLLVEKSPNFKVASTQEQISIDKNTNAEASETASQIKIYINANYCYRRNRKVSTHTSILNEARSPLASKTNQQKIFNTTTTQFCNYSKSARKF